MVGIPQGAKDGGAVMTKDGRYVTKGQGRRCDACPWKGGMLKEPWKDTCSSTTTPALSYYRPSMDICIIFTAYIHVGKVDVTDAQRNRYNASQLFLLLILFVGLF
jgi:hypothetical protein